MESGALPPDLQPSLKQARKDVPTIYNDGCHLDFLVVAPPDNCVFGDPDSPINVVLLGDSHAAQWFPAIEQLADERDWRLTVLTKSACPPVEVTVWQSDLNRVFRECDAWRTLALGRIADLQPDIVFTSAASDYDIVDASGRHLFPDALGEWRQGLTDLLTTLRTDSPRVVFIADTPLHANDPLECLASKGLIEDCPDSRDQMVNDSYSQLEVDVAQATGAELISAIDWLCPDTTCPPVIGNYLVYRDTQHVTATFATVLTDSLAWALDRLP